MEACLFVFNSLSYFGTSNRKIQRYRVICELLYNVKKTIKKGSFLTLFAATGFKLTPLMFSRFLFFFLIQSAVSAKNWHVTAQSSF